ncbi:MAG: hypothetical protein AAFR47_18710 [Pseudomonadota bacterium]
MCDRHGKVRWRFRSKGFSCYLPGDYASAAWREAYEAARQASVKPARAPADTTSLHWLVTQYLASPRYRDRSESSRRVLRKELD